ncbi:MAG: DUF5683 domain-containing protein [Saprospiraceae bacterium]
MRYFILVFSLIVLSISVSAQSDTGQSGKVEEEVLNVSDTSDAEVYVDTLGVGFWRKLIAPTYPNPERAAALSFVLPGAGQVYNKKFWYIKVPVIYGGYAFLIQRGEANRALKNRYSAAYISSLNGETHEFSGFAQGTTAALKVRRDLYDKNFQLSYIGVVILHFVQTLEAYTTAHLLKFDMDESLTIHPTFIPSDPMGFGGSKPGITVGIQLGR